MGVVLKITFGLNISDSKAAAFVPTGLPILELTLNALAFGTFSAGRSRYVSTTDGVSLFYNFAFPRDFVSEVNSEDTISTDASGVTIPKDPFYGYRDDNDAINAALKLTIDVPSTMRIGGNSHAKFVEFADIKNAWDDDHPFFTEPSLGASHPRGTIDGSHNSYVYYAMSDPSFMIDFNSNEVTAGTTQDTELVFNVNGGHVIGAGGFGGYGSLTQDLNDYTVDLAGGGGGGGRGLHPDLITTADSANNTWSLKYRDFGIVMASSYANTILGGQGGRSASYWDGAGGSADPAINSSSGTPAANGGFGNTTHTGAGGLNSTHAHIVTVSNAADRSHQIFHGGHGGWGGSAFYFRSNTYTSTPLTGTSIEIIATDDAIVAGGGGGGDGGHFTNDGSNGGALGVKGATKVAAATYPRGGLAGAALFWNTANVACSNTFTLTDTGGGDAAKIVGRDIILEL